MPTLIFITPLKYVIILRSYHVIDWKSIYLSINLSVNSKIDIKKDIIFFVTDHDDRVD